MSDDEAHAEPVCNNRNKGMNPEQFEFLIKVLDQDASWEVAAWIAGVIAAAAAVITTGAAVYTLLFVRKQLLAAHAGTKATFLVNLDQRWEGHEMKEARAKWFSMSVHVMEHVKATYPNLTTAVQQARMAEYCNEHLYALRQSSPAEYNDIMSVFGFFETVGYTVEKGFLSADEVADLYGESILEFDRLCRVHTEKRIEDSTKANGTPSLLWQNARKLVASTKKFYRVTQTGP